MPQPDKSRGQEDRWLVAEDEKQRALYLRQMELVPPTVGIFDEPTRCYTINKEWAKIVMGMVSWLTEIAPWRDAQDESYMGIEQISWFLQGQNCGGNMAFQLRQNPLDTCQLEQSWDSGETWSLAFDYSMCGEDADTPPDSTVAIDDYYALLDQYDGTVASIAPDMVYDATATDEIRDLALCQALQDLVIAMCEAELEKRRRTAIGASIGAIVLGIVGIGLALTTFGAGAAIWVALSGLLVAGYGVLWSGLSPLALEDTAAQILVACCMYEALKSDTITRAAFLNSLNACGFPSESHEQLIGTAVVGSLFADGVYESFLQGIEQAFKYANIGIYDCPCEESTAPWEYDSDFNTDPNGWVPYTSTINNNGAVWTLGTGWSQASVQMQTGAYWRVCSIVISFNNPVHIDELSMIFNYTKGAYASPTLNAIYIEARIGGEFGSIVASVGETFTASTSGTNKSKALTVNDECDYLRFHVRSSHQVTPSYSGLAKINSVHVEGTGIEPAELLQVME